MSMIITNLTTNEGLDVLEPNASLKCDMASTCARAYSTCAKIFLVWSMINKFIFYLVPDSFIIFYFFYFDPSFLYDF